jgi:hypothetical protein
VKRVLGLVACSLLTACAGGGNGSTVATPSVSPSVVASPTSTAITVEGCPVADERFCGAAVDVATALGKGDAGELFDLSRADTIECSEVAREYFPGCRTDTTVLEGYGLSGATFIVEVVSGDRYRRQLDAIVDGVDPAFSDELGDGAPRVLGVGTCGPDIPGRRTYHLAWTAAVSEGGAPAERLLGSFELTFEDDWRIALWYLDTLEAWEAEQTDPLTQAFCEAGRTPWLA